MSTPAVPPHFFTQSGVVAVRRRNGRTEVLLVSSRSGRRWVIPKGVVEEGLSPADSAVKEAWEEAGVRGRVDGRSLGSYSYVKWGGTCRVEVFRLLVEAQSEAWPEQGTRSRRWMRAEEAASLVRERGLARIIETAAVNKGAAG